MILPELGPAEWASLKALRECAEREPVDMPALMQAIETPSGKDAHMERMTAQTLALPDDYLVTFFIESGHPVGVCRHLSVSRSDRLPTPEAVWYIAHALGFVGDLSQCRCWIEDLRRAADHRTAAVNVVQPLDVVGRPPLTFDEADQPGEFRIAWSDANKEPKVAPNPAFPHGMIVDMAEDGAPACWVNLPYPFRRIGVVTARCVTCLRSVALTTAGRPDDPRRLRLPCGNSELSEVRRTAFPAPN